MFVASRAYSAKDQPGHTKLKYRQEGQASAADVSKRDLRAELEERERKSRKTTFNIDFEEERKKDLLLLEQSSEATARAKALIPKAIDADESDPDDSDDSDDSDEDDDEAELLRELERIKKEREQEAAKKAAEEAAQAASEKERELISGNPLLNSMEPSFSIKRRWDDDVVFKNQTRGQPKVQKRFINDTIRNDFHRRFLQRYIK